MSKEREQVLAEDNELRTSFLHAEEYVDGKMVKQAHDSDADE